MKPTKETIKEVKANAEKVAAYLGYDVEAKINLNIINILDCYCRGFFHAYEPMKEAIDETTEALRHARTLMLKLGVTVDNADLYNLIDNCIKKTETKSFIPIITTTK